MIVGIDIGGTKTHLRGRSGDGERDLVLDTAAWRARCFANDAPALAALVCGLTETAAPTAVVVGAHGCDTDADCARLQAQLAQHLDGIVLVLNDSELLLPATGTAAGIAVIAGTGSIAVGRSTDRQMVAAGGWGWFLGDEGSACGLVREAARAVRGALDAGGSLDPLGRTLLDALGIADPVQLGQALGALDSGAAIGRLAPIVFAVESPLASRVIAEGGRALALLAERLLERGVTAERVVAGGGVIVCQPRLFDAFRTALAEHAPTLRPVLLAGSPVSGAVRLASRLAAGERPALLPLPHVGGRPESGCGAQPVLAYQDKEDGDGPIAIS